MSELENQINIQILNKQIEKFEDESNLTFKNYSVLSMIKENNLNNSNKTLFSSSCLKLKKYEINKFDELNKSLSDISNFDLEKEDDCDLSFNSSKDDDEIEAMEIFISKKINKNFKEKNIEFEIELDKEFEEIKKEVFTY